MGSSSRIFLGNRSSSPCRSTPASCSLDPAHALLPGSSRVQALPGFLTGWAELCSPSSLPLKTSTNRICLLIVRQSDKINKHEEFGEVPQILRYQNCPWAVVLTPLFGLPVVGSFLQTVLTSPVACCVIGCSDELPGLA